MCLVNPRITFDDTMKLKSQEFSSPGICQQEIVVPEYTTGKITLLYQEWDAATKSLTKEKSRVLDESNVKLSTRIQIGVVLLANSGSCSQWEVDTKKMSVPTQRERLNLGDL